MAEPEDKGALFIQLPEKLKRELKIESAKTGKKMRELVIQYITEGLSKSQQ